ncbi:MAG TPA: hypothetical protein DEQ02_02060 [Ruminococcaceae bacterium]|nr:hypothetical protein [Oscillospiraceae bacterium]
MDNKKPEIYLIVAALIMAGFIIVFNALSAPPLASPTAAYYPVEESSSAGTGDESSDTQDIPDTPESSQDLDNEDSVPSRQSRQASSGAASSSRASRVSSAASSKPADSSSENSSPSAEISEPPSESETEEDLYININSATAEELTALPSIGGIIAQRIVDYRETYGSFLTVDDLLEVNGIGERTLEKLRPYVYAG